MLRKRFKIKKGDTVLVISGDDKGRKGEILKVLHKKDSVIVSGCKIATKTIKPDKDKNKNGGFIDKEMPIHISNVKKAD